MVTDCDHLTHFLHSVEPIISSESQGISTHKKVYTSFDNKKKNTREVKTRGFKNYLGRRSTTVF